MVFFEKWVRQTSTSFRSKDGATKRDSLSAMTPRVGGCAAGQAERVLAAARSPAPSIAYYCHKWQSRGGQVPQVRIR